MHALEMISRHPEVRTFPVHGVDAIAACVEACFDCAQACTACADACLGEEAVADLRRCIRLNLDCAALCSATAEIGSRRTHPNLALLRKVLETCAEACSICQTECARHASMHDHCRICAEACAACEQACRAAIVAGELP